MTIDWESQSLRTFPVVPGTEREKFGKFDRFTPDIGVIYLEDAVATSQKAAARTVVRGVLEEGLVRTPLFVRINALSGCARTLIAAPPQVLTGGVGLGDLAKDLGVDFVPASPLALHARVTFAIAARAAGLQRPIDGAYPRLDDLEGLAADSRLSKSLGYQGRLAVHPRQVDTINAVYGSLSDTERRAAQRIVEAFEQAEAEGRASIDVDGRLVDYPIYDRAKAKLAEER